MPKLTGFSPVALRGPRHLPLIGVQLGALRLLGDPIGRLRSLQREYGNLVAISDKSPALVIAFGADHNREVLSNPAAFDNDTDLLFDAEPGTPLRILARGLVFQAGEAHRRLRRLMMPAFQKAAIEAHASDIVAVTEDVLDTWPVGQTVDVAFLLKKLVERIAVRCLFGLDPRDGDQRISQISVELIDLLTSPLTAALPYRYPGSPYSRVLDLSEELLREVQQLIEDKRRSPQKGRDVLELLLRSRDEDGSRLTDEELIGGTNTLFVAGHDTQAKSLSWMLFLLSQHPSVLASMLDEVESVLRGAAPTVESIAKMPLTDRIIKESMRILAAVPVTFIRVAQTEARLGPVVLPEKANVILSPFVSHRDPAVYPEPDRFLPERWERISPSVYEYLPFGAGPRMCIGASFATLTLRLILPMIVKRFRFTLAHGARVSRLVRGNVLAPKYGLPMLLAPQDRRFSKGGPLRGDISELVAF